MDVFFDKVFLRHDTGLHPENAGRLESILDYLDYDSIKAPQNGEKYLKLAHTEEYVDYVRLMSRMGGRLDPDTKVSKESYKAACFAAGAAIDASKSGGFALVRPPGHHAFSDHGSGFCVFNSIAIAALNAAKEGKRVFILDIDVHHGNGTEEIVIGKEDIEFLSMHQSPLYPGSGIVNRTPNVINVPLEPGSGDREYILKLEERVEPAIRGFEPDLVGISVGFDAYRLDCGWVAGNSLAITSKSYEKLRKIVKPYTTFFCLEGGYNPRSILEGSRALMGI